MKRTIIRVTIDIPIDHHPDADREYLAREVKYSVYNGKASCCSTDEKDSYSIGTELSKTTEVLSSKEVEV